MWKPNPNIEYSKFYDQQITIYYDQGKKNIPEEERIKKTGIFKRISKCKNTDNYSIIVSTPILNPNCPKPYYYQTSFTIVSNLIDYIKVDSCPINNVIDEFCEKKLCDDLSNIILEFSNNHTII